MLHSDPFQCSVKLSPDPLTPIIVPPTAQTSFGATAVTPYKSLLSIPRFGLGTMLQAVPFNRSISVWRTPLLPR